MTIKPFAIQGADLTLGGVNLQAGTTTIVIPGVTQATNYFAEEVNEQDGNNPDTFGGNTNLVYVIDNADYVYRSGGAQPSGTYQPAVYYVDELDDGQIEEINIESGGTFAAADKTRAEASNMWAIQHALGEDPLDPFVAGDWTQIPFRPKMRAGAVENVSGGSGGVVERSIEFPAGAEGDTAGTLALTSGGNLYICKTDWVDYSDAGGGYGGLETSENFLPGQNGFVSNQATMLRADLPSELLYILTNVAIVPSDWSITMDDEEFGGEYTCTGVAFNVDNNPVFSWPYRDGTDPVGIPEGSTFTVSYNGEVPQPAIWEQIDIGSLGDLEVQFGNEITNSDGDITLNADADILLESGDDIRITADDDIRIRTRTSNVHIITNWDSNNNSDHVWDFDTTGDLTIPGNILKTTDLSITVGEPLGNVEVNTVDEWGPPGGPGGVWRLFIGDEAYPTLGTTVQIGDTVTTSWGTPITATITDIVQDNGDWQIHVAQDITAGHNDYDTVTFSSVSTKNWEFDASGNLTLPEGGDILDSNGNSVLGGSSSNVDYNIWIQTFASQDGFPVDVVSLATSVEYDNAGNIIALFSHQTGIGEFNVSSGSYFSVAKFTAAGLKLWQVRLTADISSVYTDGWGLAVDNVAGRIYVAGRVDDEVGYSKSSLIKLNSEDGSLIWSNVYDFGDRSDSPVVDVDSDGNPVMVGFYSTEVDTNDGITVTKISKLDGTVVWSRLLDGQGDDEAYGMAVGPTGEVVAVGYMDQYDEPLSHPVTPQTGSGVNVLVINRSDLSGDTLTDAWEVAGTGITGTIGVNAINVYTGLTGTVREGSGATFDFVIAGDGSITNPVTVANGGTNYLVGHKIKIPYTLIGGADANSDIILTVTGATDGVITSVAAGFFGGGSGSPTNYYSAIGTNYQTGSGLEFDLELDSGSTYTEHPFNITAAGTNYVTGDVVTISGALLGGTSPANDVTTTVSTDAGGVSTFNSFTGTQQTTTYRVRTDDFDVDFSGTGTWTLSGVVVDQNDRMLVVKYSSTGTIQWQKAIQFDAGYSCRGADADIDSQGNVYVCGNYDYDANGEQNSAMNLVKFDSSGVKQWSRRVVGDCEDFATSIVVGPDDTLYLNGITSQLINDTPRFVWVVAKYTTSGTVVWQRLIENTTGWSFSGGGFFNAGGGSNLAVRQGYVALSGGFGEAFFGVSAATVVQIDTDGTVFNVGDWEFKSASFSGTLNSTASDITVVNAEKVDSAITGIIVDDTLFGTDTTNFLIPTLYTAPSGDSSLVNGAYTVALGNTGAVTLPAGGTITEGYVTSNPTIQLTPASPDVASQKLVIKGGGAYTYTDNGISINYNNNTAIVGNTLTFYINSNTYADQTLYWWIHPSGANISDPGSGTVVLSGTSGSFSFDLDSDDNEFTVRVSPEDNNYDPASLGVETGLINADAPTFDSEHHLHLTTGDLTETSIFLGTDDQNVRTTVNGGIEITTPTNNVWRFDTDGTTTFPTLTVPISDNATPTGTGQTIKFSDSTQQAIIYGPPSTADNISAERVIVQGAPGYTGTTGEGGDVYLWAGPGGSANGQGGDIKVRAGEGIGSGNGGYLNFQAGDSATGDGGWINIESGSSNTQGSGGDITIEARSGGEITLRTYNGSTSQEWLFAADGKTTLPGALVKSTVAKTGVILPITTGAVSGLTHDSVLGGLTDGTYGPFTLTGVTLSVVVFGGVINGFTNVSGTATVNDVLGTIDSGDVGGTAGTTITITVTGVQQPTPTALDLTKSVNKLTDGVYTLADGVEGQIMYLVRQTGSTYNAIIVSVANARVNGSLETTIDYYPFENIATSNMSTLIFTDGAWQADNGGWD